MITMNKKIIKILFIIEMVLDKIIFWHFWNKCNGSFWIDFLRKLLKALIYSKKKGNKNVLIYLKNFFLFDQSVKIKFTANSINFSKTLYFFRGLFHLFKIYFLGPFNNILLHVENKLDYNVFHQIMLLHYHRRVEINNFNYSTTSISSSSH